MSIPALFKWESPPPGQGDSNIGALWFEVSQRCSKKIFVGAIYRPPNADASDFTASIEEMLNTLLEEGTETVLLGDFNFDYISPSAATKNFQRTA